MRIIVTGGAGFIGSHLTDALLKRGHHVSIIDNLSTGKKENLNPKAKFYCADITDPKQIPKIFKKEKPEAVFHLAAQTSVRKSVEDPLEDARVNILGGLNILQNFIRVNPRLDPRKSAFLFASTGGALYGEAKMVPTPEKYPIRPLSPYGNSKYTFENYLDVCRNQIPFTILRFANVYGPRQDPYGEAGVVAIFINQLLRGKQPTINGDGRQTRDFIYVGDVVEACLSALPLKKNTAYNVGTGRETSINKLFHHLIKITGIKKKEKHGGAKPGEQKRSALDCRKIKRELGWKPNISLEEGLEKTVEWFRKNVSF